MFESLEDLSKRLPRPQLTGDWWHDQQVHEQYIANAKQMRSEAMACIGRALVQVLISGWRRLSAPVVNSHSHQT